MFAKFEEEKISSTEFQGILKEKKKTLRFARLSTEKESSDDCHAIEKAKNKRAEEMELA